MPASATASPARAWTSSVVTGSGSGPGVRAVRAPRAVAGVSGAACGGQVGQGAPPGGDALAGEHAEPERERARACVQGGMTQLLVAGVQPAAGNAWPGRHPGGCPVQQPRGQVKVAGTGTGVLLPALAGGQVSGFWSAPGGGPARARRSGGARAPRTPRRWARPGRPAVRVGIGCQLLLGPGEDLAGELVAAAGPGPGRHQPVQAGLGQGGGGLVVRRPGVPERRRGRGDRRAVHRDAAHHLVLDLHRVAGVEELLGQERLVGDLLGMRVQAPRLAQCRHLRVLR